MPTVVVASHTRRTLVKQAFRTSILAGVVVLGVMLTPAAAQTASLKAEALKDWGDLKTTMAKIVAEMPDDKFSFKPTPAQQTFAERTVHVSTANVRFLGALGAKAVAPMIDAKATTKE